MNPLHSKIKMLISRAELAQSPHIKVLASTTMYQTLMKEPEAIDSIHRSPTGLKFYTFDLLVQNDKFGADRLCVCHRGRFDQEWTYET